MNPSSRQISSACSLLLFILQTAVQSSSAASQFTSHISVNTPARSYSHGVGDPVGLRRFNPRRNYQGGRSLRPPPIADNRIGSASSGYPRERPLIPFTNEEIPPGNSISAPWQYNDFVETAIPVLPPSPYKVDSSDPESLWPEGLFLPPLNTPRFGHQANGRRSDNTAGEVPSDSEYLDPYLLEGSEAIAAVQKASLHGLYYFHDIPHIESLLDNQEVRIRNNLKPHRIGSIRHTWPYNRP